MAKGAFAEIAKGIHLGIRVVDSIDHGEFVGRSPARRLDVALKGLMKPEKRVFLHSRHELIAGGLNSGVQ